MSRLWDKPLEGRNSRERGSRQIPRDPDAVETSRARLSRSCDPARFSVREEFRVARLMKVRISPKRLVEKGPKDAGGQHLVLRAGRP